MLARYMLSLCVCPSVHLSVTSRHCTKTAKHRITKTATLIFTLPITILCIPGGEVNICDEYLAAVEPSVSDIKQS